MKWNHQFGRNVATTDGRGSSNMHLVWDDIWKSQVPAKVKIFCWKVLHGILPCLGNRHIKTSAQCPICNVQCEDILHTQFNCPRAKEVWRKLGFLDLISEATVTNRSGSDAMEFLVGYVGFRNRPSPSTNCKELIMVAAWYIWWMRRDTVNGGKEQLPADVAMSIQVLSANYSRALKKTSQPRKNCWKKAPESFVSVNVDAAFDHNTRRGATGVIIRESRGKFVGACNRPIRFAMDPCTCEALALREGISLAIQLGCNKLIMQSDCQEVIDTMKAGGFSSTVAAPIFQDIAVTASMFVKVIYEFCPRESNSVAHVLAREAGDQPYVWLDDPPCFIVPNLINNVTVFSEQ